MAKYTIETTDEQDVLIAKTEDSVQMVLEAKITELVNRGRKVVEQEVGELYAKADETTKAEIDVKLEPFKPVVDVITPE